MSTDGRPLPQYGEYASASEQASAIERSGVARPQPAAAVVPASPEVPATPAVRAKRTQLSSRTASQAVDRIATIFLLSFGFVYVIGGAESFFTLGASLNRLFLQLGIGDYTPTSLTPIIGIMIVVSQGIMWLIAAGSSYVRISRGRKSWWVPVAGGAVSFLVFAVLLGILLSADPAFLAYASGA